MKRAGIAKILDNNGSIDKPTMNRLLLLIISLFLAFGSTHAAIMNVPPVGDTSCTYTLYLRDSYGDGWNGASVRVTNLTTGGYHDYTISSYGYNDTHSFSVVEGHQYGLSWNSGSYDMECQFFLKDNLGETIYEYEPDYDPWGFPTPPTGTFFVFTAMCTDQMCSSPTSLREISHTPYTSTLRWAMDDTSVHRYKLLYGTSQDPNSMLSIITNDSTYTLTGLSPDSTYHVQLRAMCDTDAYSRWPLVTEVFTGYCEPTVYGWYGDNLSRVAFGRGAEMMTDTVNSYSYENRVSRIGGVVSGDTINISLTFQYEIPCIFVWVDWNNNYQFETNELIVSSYYYDWYNGGTRTFSYSVPEACPEGDYRIRFVTSYSTSAANPCADAEDARDYTLHVTGAEALIRYIYCDSSEFGRISINGNQYFSGGMSVVNGSSITIEAIPNTYCLLQQLVVNGNPVASPYTMTVSSDVQISASFIPNLPELHVVSLTSSDMVAGQTFDVSWTIRNDGHASTPTGTTWLDRLYLSTTPYVNTSNEPLLLGSWQNVSALDSGQTYTRSVSVTLPLRQAPGQYYLFLLTDAVNAYNIQWGGSNPDAYNPPPYALATCYAYNNSIVEISEMNTYRSNYNYWESQAYQHDNFNMKTVQVTVPQLADLEVTDINPQTNFYSGTQVTVSATITNTSSVPTLSSGWHDVLYISTSPTFSTSTALQLSSIWHPISSNLAPDSSYQVTFTGVVPLSWYGEAFFYVTTDYENNEYEYLADSNNTSRSRMVNILLTPPADLVVSNVTVPIVASNQLPINVNYSVVNMGEGNPDVNDWYDKVYLSTSPTLPTVELNSNGIGSIYNYSSIPDSVDWYYTLEQIAHVGGLAAGDHYSINRNYTLPTFITDSGLFYFIVVTDAGNNVFEYQSDNNNTTASQASSISFYFPDLVVDTIIVADSINNNESFSVTYSISNRGMGKAVAPWYDYVAISGNQLAYSLHDTDLMPGDSYSVEYTCSIPNSFITTMNRPILVTVDWNNNVDEKTNEGNNSFSVTSYATIYKPDFYISEILLPDTIVTGHSLDLQFTINNGGRHDYAGNIYYIVYYSYDSTLNYEYGYPSNTTFLQSYQHYITLPANESQTIVQSITFPNSVIDSDYYVYILVNPDGYIPEDSTQNNTLRSGPHFVCHRPLPDLVLLNVSIPDTLHAGELVTISFDITNVGETTEYGVADINSSTFYTALYANDYWCPIRMQISPVEVGSISLAVGDTLHFVQTVQVSPITSGNLNFTLTVDAHNNIQELYENNNGHTVSRHVRPVSFDLAVQNLNAVDSCMTGDTVTISYTANICGYSAFFQHANNDMVDATGFLGRQRWVDSTRMTNPLWHDNLLVSYDRFATFDDRQLVNTDVYFSDISDSTYTITRTIMMPYAFSGNIYLIAVVDSARRNIENDYSNNTLTKSIIVTQAPQPNLRIISFVVDDSVTQQQVCTLRYTVLNDGTGPTRTSHWVDKFYCGGHLASKPHEGILMPGDSYSDSIEIVIPTNLLGTYTIQAITDAENDVYEHDHENDNTASRTIVISLNPPSDLIVSRIDIADSVSLGSSFVVHWWLKNVGAGNLYRQNVTDVITYNGLNVNTYNGMVSIPIGDSVERVLAIQLPCSADSIGTLSITTDNGRQVAESNDTNNTGYSNSFRILRPQLSGIAGMIPTSDSVITHGAIVLRWNPVTNATGYNVFVWPNGQLRPTTPTYTTSVPNIVVATYDNNQIYSWNIEATNQCDTTSSPVQHYAIFKQPIVTVASNNLAFGEVEYNAISYQQLRVMGQDLTDSIQLTLRGTDSAMFSLAERAVSRYGGSVDVAFTPTALQRSFDAFVIVQSGSLGDTVWLNGLLANYYTFSVSVPDSILQPATPVPITGTLTDATHTPQANIPVDIWVTVMGRTTLITDTTDSQGHFGCTYTPVMSECGYYEVGACLHGNGNRIALTTFNIPGISINETSLPIWEIVQYDTVRGSIPVRNRCGVTLHNIAVSTITLPTGLQVVFDTLTLVPFQTDSLRYTIVGTVQSTGSRYERVSLSCSSSEGALSQLNIYYYCHKPVPNLQISFDSLYCNVVPGTQKIVDLALFNNTDSTFTNLEVQVPTGQSVIQQLSLDTAYSIAPHDSLYVPLLVSVPEDASWGIATGNMLVTADNTQPQIIPYTINPVSDATGSLTVLVSNEYTYYNNGPHVSGAIVTVVGYYSLDTVAVSVTGDDGFATIDSLPEGYYKVYVIAPENSSYSIITRIRAGETTYLDVDLVFEAIEYEWIVTQVDEEDNWDIVLNTEFKTNVPKPVITIDVPTIRVPYDGSMASFNIVVSNHGLIDSYDAEIEMPSSSIYEFFPLFDRIDTLHALSSIIVPCAVRNKSVYNMIEEIRNRGNYYIDTTYSIFTRLITNKTYHDTSILVPIGYYFDSITGGEKCIYDTTIITVPHYSVDTILDSTISHIIYYDGTSDQVLLNIDMNPQTGNSVDYSSQDIQREWTTAPKNTNQSEIECEPVQLNMVTVVTWYWCNNQGKKGTVHQLLKIESNLNLKRCQIIGIPPIVPPIDIPSIPYIEICDYLPKWICNSGKNGPGGHEEKGKEEIGDECEPCWRKIVKDVSEEALDCIVKSAITAAVTEGVGAIPVAIKECIYDIPETVLKSLIKCFNISVSTTVTTNSPVARSVDNALKVTNSKAVTTTTEEYKRLITIVAQYYHYQQLEFCRMLNDSLPNFEDHPGILNQIIYYLNTTDSATVEGLANCYDTTVGLIDTVTLRHYANRWNRTITYSRYGWTRPEQVLTGFSQDFYYPDSNNLLAIANLRNAVEQEGFSTVEELYASTIEAMKNHKTKTSTCASVSLQFRQNVAMTREAFEGRLQINNPNDTASIQNFAATFVVTDDLGHDCTDKFDIKVVSREGIDSTGTIAPNSSAVITVRFVPLMSAAPTDTVPYMFGGDISYINPFTALPKSDELNPVRLTVHPSPHLQLDYFVPHDIIADDPLTSPEIETAIPATIGMRVLNDGVGMAKNVRVSTISPQITENRQGLVVDFSIAGTMLNGLNVSQPLNDISLGTVMPNQTNTFEYAFLSSLLGTITVKDINVIHNSSIDDKDMSLVNARAHRLVKPVLQYGANADNIHDFLTDDIGNGYNLPDSLFFSDGTQTRVVASDTTTFDHYVTPTDTVVQVTLYPDSIGWNYGETDDPGKGKYEIISCVRDDNTIIPLDNIWLTFVDLLTDEDPLYVNKLHLVDTLSTIRATVYNVTFSLLPMTLNVDTILNVPAEPVNMPLDSVVVVFSEPIIDSTFSYEDMSLKCNNGQNLMDSTVSIRRLDDTTYSVNISQKNSAMGLYVLRVMTDSVVDATGRYGHGGKEVQWVRTACDPIVVSTIQSACDSLLWRDTLLTASGIYFDTVPGVLGCDTVMVLDLTINHSNLTGTVTATACDSYLWHDSTYTQTGSYPYSTLTTHGCDSVITLNLTVNYSNTGVETVTACDSFTWHGTTYYVSTNTPTFTETNAAGCDSVVTLNLTINYSNTGVETVTACDSYTWHGTNYTASTNTPTFTETNAASCDSVVTLNLTVNYSNTGVETVTACDSYIWHGTNYTASTNTPTFTETNAAGCDSVVTLNLTMNYSNTGVETVTACDSYTWHGTQYTASTNIPTFTETNNVGCDSVVTLNLTINYSNTGIETVTVCDSYTWHGTNYTASTNTPTFTETNIAGCDSVVTLNLTVNYSNTGIETVTACDSYVWHGTNYTASTNTPTFTETNAAGCDSVVTLNLTVNYSNTGVETVTACDSYIWHGTNYTASTNTPTFTETNAAGCDSVVTLNLTINYSNTGVEIVTACDSYTWHGTNYTASTNTPTFTETTIAGCDSVVTLHLTVNYSNTGVETVTACDSYVWHGTEYTASTNTPTYSTQNAVGCDSVTTLNLTINNCSTTEITACDEYTWHGQTYSTSDTYIDGTDTLQLTIHYSNTGIETVTACDSFTWWNTNYTNSTNTPTHTYTNAAGCDSVVTLNLTINYSNTSIETVTACDSLSWHGTTYYASISTPTFTSTNMVGCDSVTTLHLTMNYSNAAVETITTCDSLTWHGTTYNASTSSPTYTTTNMAGCDSVTTLHLTVNYSNAAIETITACDSNTWHGTTYMASTTTPTFTSLNSMGCDSVTTLHLTVNYSNAAVETITACDSLTWHGTTYTASTSTPTFTSTNMVGCDSVTTLHLTVNYSNTAVESITACDSNTWHGNTYTASTSTPTFTSTNAAGCDSVTTLHLTVNYSNTAVESITACDSNTWHGTTFTASNNTATFTETNVAGCDSVVTLNLTVNYSNAAIESITACDSNTWHGITYTASTNTPTYTTTNMVGCDSVTTLHLTVNYSNTGIESVTACDSNTWHGTTFTASNNTATFTETNVAGCDSVVTLNLTVNYSNTGIETITVCDSNTWHGTTYTASTNTPTYTTTNIVGCDSVTTLHLTVNYSNAAVEAITVCDSLTWHGITYTASTNTPTFTSTNAAGCDSVTTLHLTVNYSNSAIETVTACDSNTWHGTTYNTSTSSPTYTTTNMAGCDSVTTLHLTVNYSNAAVETTTACDSLTWHGSTYSASTSTPTFTSTNMVGCDSVTTLHLTVNYSNAAVETITACDSFSWWNTNYTNSTNTPIHTYTNAAGCDSVVTLNLTINYSNTGVETVTACDSLAWYGITYTASTSSPTYTSTNTAGCDSVVTLNLTVNYSNTGVETITACNSYVWHGTEYTASTNTPTFTTINAVGCDSVTTLHLTIIECSTTEITSCDSYTWHGTTYTQSGLYTYGTDTLILTINYSNSSIETLMACDSLTWHDSTYYASTLNGQYSTLNSVGCDSITTLHLTVNHSTTGLETVTACNSYMWHGTEYTSSTNTATYTTVNAAGCDSVTTLHLTIIECNTTLMTACDSYTWHDSTFTVSGTYIDGTDTLILTVHYSTSGDTTAIAYSPFDWYEHLGLASSQEVTHTFVAANQYGCDSTVTLHFRYPLYNTVWTGDTFVTYNAQPYCGLSASYVDDNDATMGTVLVYTQGTETITSPNCPVNAGTYTVMARPMNPIDSLLDATTTLTILPATVSVSGAEVETAKFYDGTADATVLNRGTLNGVCGNDNLMHATTAWYSQSEVGTNLTVTLGYTIDGPAVSNYIIAPGEVVYSAEGAILAPFIPDSTENTADTLDGMHDGILVDADGYCAGTGMIGYRLASGAPDQYRLVFSNAAFSNVDWSYLDTPIGENGVIYFDVPEDVATGDYNVTIYFRHHDFPTLVSNPVTVSFHINMPETYIVILFNDVIALIDTCQCITDIQWYRRASGESAWTLIPGANSLYYYQESGLEGWEFTVKCKFNGIQTFSCPQTDMHTLVSDEATTVTAYPNPTTGEVTIRIDNATSVEHNISLLNMMGVQLEQRSFIGNSVDLDLSGYQRGSYMVSVDGIVVRIIRN